MPGVFELPGEFGVWGELGIEVQTTQAGPGRGDRLAMQAAEQAFGEVLSGPGVEFFGVFGVFGVLGSVGIEQSGCEVFAGGFGGFACAVFPGGDGCVGGPGELAEFFGAEVFE